MCVCVCVCLHARVYTPYLPTCRDERGARQIGPAYSASSPGAQTSLHGPAGRARAGSPAWKLLRVYTVWTAICIDPSVSFMDGSYTSTYVPTHTSYTVDEVCNKEMNLGWIRPPQDLESEGSPPPFFLQGITPVR